MNKELSMGKNICYNENTEGQKQNEMGHFMSELRFDKERLAALMEARGLNDGDLAKMVGMSKSTIYYLRMGKHKGTRPEKLRKIADALGTTVDYLLGEKQEDERVPVRLPENIRQLADIASNLSEVRQEELVRIAEAFRKLEDEQQAVATPTAMRILELHEKLRAQGIGPDLLELLESLLPPPRRLVHLGGRKRPHKPGEHHRGM